MTRFIKVLATFMVAVMLFVGCSTGSGYINTASVQAVWTETETPPVEEPEIVNVKTEIPPKEEDNSVSSSVPSSSSEPVSSSVPSSSSEPVSSSVPSSSSKPVSSSVPSSSSKPVSSSVPSSSSKPVSSSAPSYGTKYYGITGESFTLFADNADGYKVKSYSVSLMSEPSIVPESSNVEGSSDIDFIFSVAGNYKVTTIFILINGSDEVSDSTIIGIEEPFAIEDFFPGENIDTGF